jgi:glutamate-5-semialdehyde dehydrogenase
MIDATAAANLPVKTLALAARQAAKVGQTLTAAQKNHALRLMGEVLLEKEAEILAANARDLEQASEAGEASSRLDRLRLTSARVAEMVEGLREVAELPDPVGEEIARFRRPNGIVVRQVRVPVGVIGMVYEARPNVTVDAAALTLKTGNAVILRGGKEALASNLALIAALREGIGAAGLPADLAALVSNTDRQTVDELIRARGLIDLVIPRGGAGLIDRVVRNAQVPVIETGVGNCHVYIDRAADLSMATAIAINAKTQRPSVCNAIETILVHAAIADRALPLVGGELLARGVELRADPAALAILRAAAPDAGERLRPATDEDYATEFGDLILAVRVVNSLDEAIEHIDRFGTKHSEAIVTDDEEAAAVFLARVDAAAVYHNASTRFTDGFEFGFGAEIGISTQKLHARGPMGLRELTSYKYVVTGTGQVRGG